MSKVYESMQQVYENTRHTSFVIMQAIELMGKILRGSTFFLCSALIVACGSHDGKSAIDFTYKPPKPAFDTSKTLNRGLLGEPRTLDPQLADDTYSFQVIRDLYEGLTAEDSSGHIVPGVANSWTVDRTGTIYIFQLRPNAQWSNGDRVIASEFVEGLRRAVDPKTASGSAALLTVIKGASDVIAGQKKTSDLGAVAIGDSAVQIRLERPAPYILEILSQPIAAPLHLDSEIRPAKVARNDTRVTTNGPYLLATRIPGSFIELSKNPYYWDAANVAIERVRYINSESEGTELKEYLAGQLDLTFTIPKPDLKRMLQEHASEVQTEPFLATLYLALNLSARPMKSDRELRQALSMSVDREMIAEQVMMGVSPAYSFVAEGVTGYTPAAYPWSRWSRDRQLAEARSLFAKAGYSLKNPLHLKIYFNRDEGINRLMVAIAGSWKQNLGVESELISDEFRVFLAERKNKNRWDVARLGWTADYDDPSSFLDVFAQNSNQNDPGFVSAAFDDSISKAEAEPNSQQRLALLRNAEQIMLDDYPIIPIYFYKARRLVKPNLGGARLTPMNRTYSKHLYWKMSY